MHDDVGQTPTALKNKSHGRGVRFRNKTTLQRLTAFRALSARRPLASRQSRAVRAATTGDVGPLWTGGSDPLGSADVQGTHRHPVSGDVQSSAHEAVDGAADDAVPHIAQEALDNVVTRHATPARLASPSRNPMRWLNSGFETTARHFVSRGRGAGSLGLRGMREAALVGGTFTIAGRRGSVRPSRWYCR